MTFLMMERMKSIISRYAEKKTEQEEKYDKIEGLKCFLSVYHTLGNFIPVSTGCNAPRGTFCRL